MDDRPEHRHAEHRAERPRDALEVLDHLLAPIYIRLLFGAGPLTPDCLDGLVDRLLAWSGPSHRPRFPQPGRPSARGVLRRVEDGSADAAAADLVRLVDARVGRRIRPLLRWQVALQACMCGR
ncbi:hypothetical protein ACGFI3_10395 [Nonomuraea wenchangensis]|uniref:hypothetical protein n=1 Tax=Nonomuraea wenchangensis TaxID=568860 RepID=UPI00371F536B